MVKSKIDLETIVGASDHTKHPIRKFLWFVVGVLLLAVIWYGWSGSIKPTQNIYTSDAAKISDIMVTVSATGTVEPTNAVNISSELSGIISSVAVDFNESVKKGQILATLNTANLEASIEQSKATLIAQKAQVSNANATQEETLAVYESNQRLEMGGVVSSEALLSAKLAYVRAQSAVRIANANVLVAEANLQLDKVNLNKAYIYSSLDGVVLGRDVVVGQTVVSSQAPTLFTLAEDLTKMELQVYINEADIGLVKVGNEASFSVEAYQDRDYPAEISELRLSPETIDGVVSYEAILTIDNSDLSLLPGMTASADITVKHIKQVIAVPNAALRYAPPATQEADTSGGSSGLLSMFMGGGGPQGGGERQQVKTEADGEKTIYILKDQQAVAVIVETGLSDGVVTQILKGDVSAGDLIITDMETSQ
ncbi:MAG: efflux transporter periplasmic adaptor subunit [Hyphomicrobiales bacterium]|nr:MAG: efflux transporter periplasmic adaptor subunit [Hyphomicrobiales bacterium]